MKANRWDGAPKRLRGLVAPSDRRGFRTVPVAGGQRRRAHEQSARRPEETAAV